jgi:Spy/CpxP family protein refolding chaperone
VNTRTLHRWVIAATAAVLGATAAWADDASPSPYTGQETRSIKALSDRETADLLAGHGMGFARAAELNRYPGPLHVIELADKLNLSPEQRARTDEIFIAMQSKAKSLGAEIVAAEQALDQAFADGTIDEASLAAQTDALGRLYGRGRATHLAAHLDMRALLSPHQIAAYDRLRGYSAAQPDSPPSSPHSGHH